MISNMIKKITDMIRRPEPMAESYEKEEDALLFFRKEMITMIQQGRSCQDIMISMVHVAASSFTTKYALLNVASLLHLNNQSIRELKQIVFGLSAITKYALRLLRPLEERGKNWNIFPFNHYVIKAKITPLIGYDTILHQLGYITKSEHGLNFAPDTEPNLQLVANLIVDMMLFKTEIKEYLRGHHPMADQLNEFLPHQTIEEVCTFQQFYNNPNVQSSGEDNDDLSSSDENPFEENHKIQAGFQFGHDDFTNSANNATIQETSLAAENPAVVNVISAQSSNSLASAPLANHVISRPPVNNVPLANNVISRPAVNNVPSPPLLSQMTSTLPDNSLTSTPRNKNEEVLAESDFNSNNKVMHRDPAFPLPEVYLPSVEGPATGSISTPSSNSLHLACDVCGGEANVFCRECMKKPLCNGCNESFHKHPSRRNHRVESISNLASTSLESQPHVQIEGAYGIMAQNQSKAMRLNKTQETEVVKSPSKGQKNLDANLPALGLLGFNSVGEMVPEHRPQNDINDATLQGQLRQFNLPNHPGVVNGQIPNLPSPLMYGNSPINMNESPSSIRPLAHFQNPAGSPQALPVHLITHSLSPHGRSPFIEHNQPFAAPYIDAQMNFNEAKIRMARGQISPQQGLDMSQEQMYFNHPSQRHWPPGSQPIPTVASNYSHNLGSLYQPPSIMDSEQMSMMHYPSMSMSHVGQMPHNKFNTMHSPYISRAGQNNPNVSFSGPQTLPLSSSTHPNYRIMQGNMPGNNNNNSNSIYNNNHNNGNMMFNTGGLMDPKNSLPSVQYRQSSLLLQSSQSSEHLSMHPSNAFISSTLKNIMSIPDASQRKNSCHSALEELKSNIKFIEGEIDKILLQEDIPMANERFSHLNHQKSMLLKEKDLIKKYLTRLNEEVNMPKDTTGASNSNRVIYFPPTMDPQKMQLEKKDRDSPNLDSKILSVQRENVLENKHSPIDEIQVRKSNLPKENHHNITSRMSPVPSQNEAKIQVEKQKPIREPVESSSVIESPRKSSIPPREDKRSELVSTLDQTFAPPNSSQLKLENSRLRWQCEHCTYINQPSSHACEICSKTSDNPQLMEEPCDETDRRSSRTTGDPLLDLLNEDDDNQVNIVQNHFAHRPGTVPLIISAQDQVMHEKKLAQTEFASNSNKGDSDVQLTQGSMKCEKQQTPVSTPVPVGEMGNSDTSVLKREDKALEALARRREMEMNSKMKKEGKEFVQLIKSADLKGYKVEAVEIALTFCKAQNMEPLKWLEDNWKKYLEKIINQVKRTGNEEEEGNCVGELSWEEAEAFFIRCHGNVNDAIDLAVENRIELFTYLNSIGNFPREEILQAMLSQKGDRSATEKELIQLKLLPFMDRIWARCESDCNDTYGLHDLPQPEYYNSFSTSIISHGNFQRMIKNKDLDRERRIRMILVEGKLKSWGRADLVIKILDEDLADVDLALEDVVEAVRNCLDRQGALVYLQQLCCICFSTFPMSKIRSLNFCQCKMCEECLTKNFEFVIREKHIRNWTCPMCGLPDISKDDVAFDYLQFLSLLLQPLIDQQLKELFETKVRDFHLQKDPNFRWCAHCAMGFLAENPNQLRITCFNCHEQTCYKCKKQWEDQHEGLTCEQFALWKIENDPANQAVGLAKHLEENGIDCPSCKMRFALAKGGCMHFHCPECGHEFCSGCNEAYYKAGVCTKYMSCRSLGLHCHHPRDCFSHLRDNSVAELQSLLKQCHVSFNVQTPKDQEDSTHCPVMEQKESGGCKKDEKCGKDSVEGQAGLCESHYKEYLTGLINVHGLDPLLIMTTKDMEVLLKRYDLQVPDRLQKETEEDYKSKLSKVIQEKLPLQRK